MQEADDNGATPLHFATLAGLLKNVQVLIKFGAPVNMKDDDGNSPLHIAVLQLIQTVKEKNRQAETHQNMRNTEIDRNLIETYTNYKTVIKELLFSGALRSL